MEEENYKNKLSEIEDHCIGSAVYSLGGIIDYYEKELHGSSRGFHEYMTAHDINLQTNLSDRYHSLANLEHTEALHTRFSDILEKLVPEIETTIANTQYEKKELKRTIDRVILEPKKQLSAFKEKYATEISTERASEQYDHEKRIIEETMEDIKLASSGLWVPKLVSINGGERQIESPASAALSKIAEKARATNIEPIREIAEHRKEYPRRPSKCISMLCQLLRRET